MLDNLVEQLNNDTFEMIDIIYASPVFILMLAPLLMMNSKTFGFHDVKPKNPTEE